MAHAKTKRSGNKCHCSPP